jgi:hypothetical protein
LLLNIRSKALVAKLLIVDLVAVLLLAVSITEVRDV